MLDHVSIGVSDIERSKTFYDQALKPLGIKRLYAEDGFATDRTERRSSGSGLAKQCGRGLTSPLPPRIALRWTRSMLLPCLLVVEIMAARAFASAITPITTALSCLIQTGTTLKPSVAVQRSRVHSAIAV